MGSSLCEASCHFGCDFLIRRGGSGNKLEISRLTVTIPFLTICELLAPGQG